MNPNLKTDILKQKNFAPDERGKVMLHILDNCNAALARARGGDAAGAQANLEYLFSYFTQSCEDFEGGCNGLLGVTSSGATKVLGAADGSVIIHRVERDRHVFDKNGEHWLDSFHIEIEVGSQSFDLAYEAETHEAAQWYVTQVVNALSRAGMRVSSTNSD